VAIMARKKITIVPVELIELEDQNFHILLNSQLSGNNWGKWVIDTGASKTVFDINLKNHFKVVEMNNTEIQSAGIGEGNIETQVGMLHSINIGALHLIDEPVALINLKFINELYSKFSDEQIVGLIGSDFLVKYQAIINYKKKELKLYY